VNGNGACNVGAKKTPIEILRQEDLREQKRRRTLYETAEKSADAEREKSLTWRKKKMLSYH